MFMHPEIARDLVGERQRDMLSQAQRRHLARRLRAGARITWPRQQAGQRLRRALRGPDDRITIRMPPMTILRSAGGQRERTRCHRPWRARWRAWRARFGLAEACGSVGAAAGFAAGYRAAGSLVAAAGLATVGEFIGFYGCAGTTHGSWRPAGPPPIWPGGAGWPRGRGTR